MYNCTYIRALTPHKWTEICARTIWRGHSVSDFGTRWTISNVYICGTSLLVPEIESLRWHCIWLWPRNINFTFFFFLFSNKNYTIIFEISVIFSSFSILGKFNFEFSFLQQHKKKKIQKTCSVEQFGRPFESNSKINDFPIQTRT